MEHVRGTFWYEYCIREINQGMYRLFPGHMKIRQAKVGQVWRQVRFATFAQLPETEHAKLWKAELAGDEAAGRMIRQLNAGTMPAGLLDGRAQP